MPRVLATTSWDDGDPLDLRLASLLASRGASGTFYVCRSYDARPVLSPSQLRELASVPGVEVGCHTLTHPDLRSAPRLEEEVSPSWLADILGRDVRSFCYPKGLHSPRVVAAVRSAGYRVARTTMGGCTSPSDPLRTATTAQLYPHRRATQVRHAVKERDWRGLRSVLRVPWSLSPSELLRAYAARASSDPVVLHVWGHSWEVEEHGLWDELSRVLDVVESLGATWVTNGELAA